MNIYIEKQKPKGKREGIQLCYPFEERRLLDPKFGWVWPVIVQPKLDGERCRVYPYIYREPLMLSSECNVFQQLPHIREAIKKQMPMVDPNRFFQEYDGELYNHQMTFEQINSICSRKNEPHPEFEKIGYYIYDLVRASAQGHRLHQLESMVFEPPLYRVTYTICTNMEEVINTYKMFLGMKYEGIVVRHLMMPYVRKRSRFVMKFKPKKHDIYEIVRVYEAISQTGTPKGMIGGFECKDPEGQIFSVGAGEMPHKEREFWWNNRGELPGMKLMVQYQNLTAKHVPRFGLAVWPQPFWGKEVKE